MAFDDLLDLTKSCRLPRVILDQLAEALFGEVGPDAGMARVGPQGGQYALEKMPGMG